MTDTHNYPPPEYIQHVCRECGRISFEEPVMQRRCRKCGGDVVVMTARAKVAPPRDTDEWRVRDRERRRAKYVAKRKAGR